MSGDAKKKKPIVINGETYYTLTELSEVSEVSVRVLRKWFNDGDLVYYITMYVSDSGYSYYKMGLPSEDDVLLEGHGFKYKLPHVRE